MILSVWCLIIAALWPGAAFANDGVTPINVATLERAVKVSDYGSYLTDVTLPWHTSIEEDSQIFDQSVDLPALIALAADGQFQPITTRHSAHNGAHDTIIHVRIPLTNPSAEAQSFILAFNKPDFGFSSSSLVVDGRPLPTAPFFTQAYESDWDDPDALVHHALELPARATATIFVSYSNTQNAIPMTVEAVDHYEDRRRKEAITYLIILVLIVFIALFVVTLMSILGHPAAIAYAGYLMTMCPAIYVLDSSLYHGLFGPTFLVSGAVFMPLVHSTLGFYLIFLSQFLRTAPGSTTIEKVLKLVGIFFLVSASCVWIFLSIDWFLFFANFIVIVPIPLSLIAGYVAIKKKQRGSWPLFLGILVIMSTVVVRTFGANFHFPIFISYKESGQFLHIAVLVEAITFAIAMLLQVRGLRIERRDALLAQVDATRQKLEMSEALTGAAHDMRQPLAALNIALAEPGRQGSSDSLRSAVQFLDDIVSSTLVEARQRHAEQSDFSHDPPPSDAETEPFAVDLLFTHLENMLGADASAKGLNLRFAPCDAAVDVNPIAIMRITANLTSNAIKNTVSGNVSLGCYEIDDELEISITDTGPGMDTATLEQMQRPFVRNGNYDGAGLGLNIVRQLCDEHSYGFSITSEEGRGTRACVTVPLSHKQL